MLEDLEIDEEDYDSYDYKGIEDDENKQIVPIGEANKLIGSDLPNLSKANQDLKNEIIEQAVDFTKDYFMLKNIFPIQFEDKLSDLGDEQINLIMAQYANNITKIKEAALDLLYRFTLARKIDGVKYYTALTKLSELSKSEVEELVYLINTRKNAFNIGPNPILKKIKEVKKIEKEISIIINEIINKKGEDGIIKYIQQNLLTQ